MYNVQALPLQLKKENGECSLKREGAENKTDRQLHIADTKPVPSFVFL